MVVIAVLVACKVASLQPVGFTNHTRHTDAQLWSLWNAAQQSVSQQIDLNPLERQLKATSPEILPGDTRAWSIRPMKLIVASQPDEPSTALLVATGARHADPTGLIACPQPCNVNYAPAYSVYASPGTYYAESWELSDSDFDYLLQYEFENQILNALGYDVQWR